MRFSDCFHVRTFSVACIFRLSLKNPFNSWQTEIAPAGTNMYNIFGGLVLSWNILPRISFCNGWQWRARKPQTFHTCDRYRQVELRPKPGNKAYKKFFDNPEMASFEGFGRPTIFKNITRRLNYRDLNLKTTGFIRRLKSSLKRYHFKLFTETFVQLDSFSGPATVCYETNLKTWLFVSTENWKYQIVLTINSTVHRYFWSVHSFAGSASRR